MGYEALVLKALRSVLMGQRGQVCVIKLRKLVRACGLEPTWFNSFNVRRVLEDLREHGLIDLYSERKHVRYIISRRSPLWVMLTSGDPPGNLKEVYERLKEGASGG